jgi:hypothetical protein
MRRIYHVTDGRQTDSQTPEGACMAALRACLLRAPNRAG